MTKQTNTAKQSTASRRTPVEKRLNDDLLSQPGTLNEKLQSLISKEPSSWLQKALARRENRNKQKPAYTKHPKNTKQ